MTLETSLIDSALRNWRSNVDSAGKLLWSASEFRAIHWVSDQYHSAPFQKLDPTLDRGPTPSVPQVINQVINEDAYQVVFANGQNGRTPARRGILVTIVVLLWSQNIAQNVQQ
jgi:hypothetical protein